MHNGLRLLVEAAEGSDARSLCFASWITFRCGGESAGFGSELSSVVECAELTDWHIILYILLHSTKLCEWTDTSE